MHLGSHGAGMQGIQYINLRSFSDSKDKIKISHSCSVATVL